MEEYDTMLDGVAEYLTFPNCHKIMEDETKY